MGGQYHSSGGRVWHRHLLADGATLAHRDHGLIQHILEGKEEGGSDGTLGDLGSNT